MRLWEKWQPKTLSDVVGQPCVHTLRQIARRPQACCVLLVGPPGCGKTSSAMALAYELGADEQWGLTIAAATEINIERCRHLFGNILRLRPINGLWNVLLIEEFEDCASGQVGRYLKVALDAGKLPQKCIVLATSNDTSRIERALLQRFKVLRFHDGEAFHRACLPRIFEIWKTESGGLPIPNGVMRWGLSGTDFSFRSALDEMQDVLWACGVEQEAVVA